MTRSWIALLAVLPLHLGCSSSESQAPSTIAEPAATLHFEPGDRFTSVGDSPLVLVVETAAMPSDRLEALASRLSLRTYPEGAAVPGRAVAHRASEDGSQKAKVVFTPDAPLGERWYLLGVAALPEGASVAGGSTKLPDGTVGARFHTGSQAVMRRVRACPGEDGATITVTFSERVALAPTEEAIRIMQRGEPVACAPIERENLPEPKDGSARTAGEIALHCSGLAPDAPITVTAFGEAMDAEECEAAQ
jgi:hypothetical protein